MRTILAALAATLLFVPGAAQAATFIYTITGNFGAAGGGYPTPAPFTMTVTVDTTTPTATDGIFTYYAASGTLTAFGTTTGFSGGHMYLNNGSTDTVRFELTDSPSYSRLTLRLPNTAISGSAAPAALTGYTVVTTSNQSQSVIAGVGAGMLPTITGIAVQQVTAVPEPTSWAMMIGGFGIAGGMLRRRRQNAKTKPLYA